MFFLSVIITIYNKEEYLHECVDSIIKNDCTCIEIILVDDGSSDSSAEICDQYALNNSNVNVIHKKNGGLVSARKAGALLAKGKYITFVDADDYVEPDLYRKAINLLGKFSDESSTVLIGSNDKEKSNFENGNYNREDINSIIIPGILADKSLKRKIIPAITIKYISTELFRSSMNKVFDLVRDGEDTLFSVACLVDAHSVVISNVLDGYHYRIISDSMSHGYYADYYTIANEYCYNLHNILQENGLVRIDEYEDVRMIIRYLDKEFFSDNDKSARKQIETIKAVMASSMMGKAVDKVHVSDLDVSFGMRIIILLLKWRKISTLRLLLLGKKKVYDLFGSMIR